MSPFKSTTIPSLMLMSLVACRSATPNFLSPSASETPKSEAKASDTPVEADKNPPLVKEESAIEKIAPSTLAPRIDASTPFTPHTDSSPVAVAATASQLRRDAEDELTPSNVRVDWKMLTGSRDTIVEWRRAQADTGSAEYRMQTILGTSDAQTLVIDERTFRCDAAGLCKVYNVNGVEIPSVQNKTTDTRLLSFSFNSEETASRADDMAPYIGIKSYALKMSFTSATKKSGDKIVYLSFASSSNQSCSINYEQKKDRYYVESDGTRLTDNTFLTAAINDLNDNVSDGNCRPAAIAKCEVVQKDDSESTSTSDERAFVRVGKNRLSDDLPAASTTELIGHLRRLHVCH